MATMAGKLELKGESTQGTRAQDLNGGYDPFTDDGRGYLAPHKTPDHPNCRTWVTGETVTAARMNEHVREQHVKVQVGSTDYYMPVYEDFEVTTEEAVSMTEFLECGYCGQAFESEKFRKGACGQCGGSKTKAVLISIATEERSRGGPKRRAESSEPLESALRDMPRRLAKEITSAIIERPMKDQRMATEKTVDDWVRRVKAKLPEDWMRR